MNEVRNPQPPNPYAYPELAHGLSPSTEPFASFTENLAIGLQLYRRNFVLIVVAILIVWGPIEILESYCKYFVIRKGELGTMLQLNSLMEGLFGVIAHASVIAIGMGDLRGQPQCLPAALRHGFAVWPRIFLTEGLYQSLVAIGLLLLILPGVLFAVYLSLCNCVTVNEGLIGLACLRRSLALTRGNFWSFLFLGTITILTLMVLGALAVLPTIAFPQIDNWWTSLLFNLVVDLLTPVLTLTYVAAYSSRCIALDGAVPSWSPPSRTTKVVISPSTPASKWWEN